MAADAIAIRMDRGAGASARGRGRVRYLEEIDTPHWPVPGRGHGGAGVPRVADGKWFAIVTRKPESALNFSHNGRENSKERLAPEVGLEPTTHRLTADCSTIELLWIPKGSVIYKCPTRASNDFRKITRFSALTIPQSNATESDNVRSPRRKCSDRPPPIPPPERRSASAIDCP